MSIAMIQAFKATTLKPTERLVAFMLADHMNDQTKRCHPSVRLLAKETGLTVRSVITSIQKLADSGYITKQETDKTGQNRHYILHPENGMKAVKEIHRCSTFTGEGDSPGVVKEIHRGGEGDSPVAVKQVHLNHKEPEGNHKFNRNEGGLGFDVEESKKPKRTKKIAPFTWSIETGWAGLTPEIVIALNAINPGVDLDQEMAHANAWLIGQGKPHSPRAMSFLSNWLKKANPTSKPTRTVYIQQEAREFTSEQTIRAMGGDDEAIERVRRLRAKYLQPS
jgi:hypothetical protein